MGNISDKSMIENLKKNIEDVVDMLINISRKLASVLDGGMYRSALPLGICECGNFSQCIYSSGFSPEAKKIIEFYEIQHETIYKKLFENEDSICLSYFKYIDTRMENQEKKYKFSKSAKFVIELENYFILDKVTIESLKVALKYFTDEYTLLDLPWQNKKIIECVKTLTKGIKTKERQFWKIYKLIGNLKGSSGISILSREILGIIILERGCLYHENGGLLSVVSKRLEIMNETTALYEDMREKKIKSSIEPTNRPRGFYASAIEYSKNRLKELQGNGPYTRKNNKDS